MGTPLSIKQYRDILREFQDHIKGQFDVRYVLNGHKPRHNPMAWRFLEIQEPESRGVKTDLLVLFENRDVWTAELDLGRYRSRPLFDNIAFAFNADETDPSGIKVSFSTRTNGAIEGSTEFSADLFKDLLKQVNRTFRNDGRPTSREQLMETLSVFMDNPEVGIHPFKPSVDISLVTDRYEPQLTEVCSKLKAESQSLQSLKDEKARVYTEVSKEIETSDEAKQIKELERKLKALREELSEKEARLLEERGYKANDDKISDKDFAVYKLTRERKDLIHHIRMTTPSNYNREKVRAVDQWLRRFNLKVGE